MSPTESAKRGPERHEAILGHRRAPRISIEVKDSRFSLATPHPEAVASTPTLTDRATPVYDAAIRPDGIIEGISNQTNATMRGRVSGARMSGEIYGLLCYYEFTADRV